MKVSEQPEYQVWSQMKQRCNNPKNKKYPLYGGRGIMVCARWVEKGKGYINFIQDMGPRPSPQHSIGRIDNDSNYEPSNCRWELPEEQSYNKTTTFNVVKGDVYGKLTATGEKRFKLMNDKPNHKRWEYEFICECGNPKWYRLDKLKQRKNLSCGKRSCNKYAPLED